MHRGEVSGSEEQGLLCAHTMLACQAAPFVTTVTVPVTHVPWVEAMLNADFVRLLLCRSRSRRLSPCSWSAPAAATPSIAQ